MSNHILPDSKVCNTCGKDLPLSEYHKNKNCKDGILPRCKSCRKIADADYIEKHKEVGKIRAKKWREANREKADKRAREWALLHPERIKENQKRFRDTEHGKISMRVEVIKRRARLRGAPGKHSASDIKDLLNLQRCKCANCKDSLKHGYHVDHRIPIIRGGSNDKGNIELLCPKCNLAKAAKLPHVFAQENGRLI